MNRIYKVSTGLTVIAISAVVGCLFLSRGGQVQTEAAAHRPDFSVSGIDSMPVGTPKQIARVKRTRTARRA